MRKWFLRPGLCIFLAGLILGAAALAGTGAALIATDQRAFCANCHTMLSAAVTQQRSTHTDLTCNQCHLPQNLTAKLPYKAYIGMYDIYAENFKDVQLPIMATAYMKDVINKNCISCHSATNANVASMLTKQYCTDCHRNVPHMRTQPVGSRMVAYE